MAIYHCECQVISRGAGRTSVAAAAYRSGSKITNKFDGVTHDYSHRGGVIYSEVVLCENAPSRLQDRVTLWNEIETMEKDSAAQLAREYNIAIPIELPQNRWADFARDLVKDLFASRGMIADFAIHEKDAENPNPHIHVMTTMRPLDINGKWEYKTEKLYVCKNPEGKEGFFTKTELALPENAEWKKQHHYSKDGNPKAKKVYLSEYEVQNNPKYKDYARIKNDRQPKTEKFGRQNPTVELWNSEAFLRTIREEVSGKVNTALESLGLEIRVDHRSYKEQGIDKIPQIHLGVAAAAMERKGIETERGNINRKIRAANELTEQIAAKDAEIEEIECTVIDEEYIYGEIDVQAIDEDVRVVRSLSGDSRYKRSELEKAVIVDIKQADRELYGLYDTSTMERLIAQQREASKKGVPAKNRNEELIRQIQEGFRSLQVIEWWGFGSRQDVDDMLTKIHADYKNSQNELKNAQAMVDNAPADIRQKYQEQISNLQSRLEELRGDLIDISDCAKTLDRIEREMRNGRPKLQPEKAAVKERKPAPAETGVGDPVPAEPVEPVKVVPEVADEAVVPEKQPSEMPSEPVKEPVIDTDYTKQADEPITAPEPVKSLEDVLAEAKSAIYKCYFETYAVYDFSKPADPDVVDAPKKLQAAWEELEEKYEAAAEARRNVPSTKWYSSKKDKDAAAEAKDISNRAAAACVAPFEELEKLGLQRYNMSPYFLTSENMKSIKMQVGALRFNLQRAADKELKEARPANLPEGSRKRMAAAKKDLCDMLDNLPEEHKIAVREQIEDFVARIGTGSGNANAKWVLEGIANNLPKSPERLQREKEQEARKAAEQQQWYSKKRKDKEWGD